MAVYTHCWTTLLTCWRQILTTVWTKTFKFVVFLKDMTLRYSLSGVSLLLLSSSHWSQGHTARHAEISQVYTGSCLKYSNVRVKWLCSLPHCRSWKKSLPPISHNFFSNYYQLIKDGAWILLKGAPKYFFFYFLFFITSIHVHFWNHCPEQCSRFPPLSEHSWLLISTPADSAVMLAILQIYLDATLN